MKSLLFCNASGENIKPFSEKKRRPLFVSNWKYLGHALTEGNEPKFWKLIKRDFSHKAFEIVNPITSEICVSILTCIFGCDANILDTNVILIHLSEWLPISAAESGVLILTFHRDKAPREEKITSEVFAIDNR